MSFRASWSTWSQPKRYIGLLLAAVLAVCGCGYHLSSMAPIALPEGITRLALDTVRQPTTEPWMEPYLRRNLRDELRRRGQVEWVGTKRAQGLFQITITSYADTGSRKASDEETVKSEVRITGEARILDANTSALLWDSDPVHSSVSYQTNTQSGTQAGKEAVQDFVQRLADRLGSGF